MVTFQNGFSNLREGPKHMATPKNQPQTFSDLEAYLTSPSLKKTTLSLIRWKKLFWGKSQRIKSPTYYPTLVPTDLHSPIQQSIPLTKPSPGDIPSSSTANPISLRDMAFILLQHGLCVMAVPSLPLKKAKKPCTDNNKRNKLQRKLQTLQSSICYDKTSSLDNRKGSEAIQSGSSLGMIVTWIPRRNVLGSHFGSFWLAYSSFQQYFDMLKFLVARRLFCIQAYFWIL